jgi:hypothetical protein
VAARLSLSGDDASEDTRRLAAVELQNLIARQRDIADVGLVSFRPLYGGNPATASLIGR